MDDSRHLLASAVLNWFDSQGPQGIVTTDQALVVTMWNRWLSAATGIPGYAAIGRPLFEVVPSLTERGFDHYYRGALAGEVKMLSHAFHRFIVPTISERHAQQMPQAGHIVPLVADGAVIGTMTVVEDVSERVTSDRELRGRIAIAEAASRVKDEFLATLSHEIRTPLNAVLGWTRIMKARRPLDETTIQRAIDVIDRNATAQLTLVTDMLDVARISSGKIRLETSSVDLGAIVRAAVDVVRPAADAKGVRLETDIQTNVPSVSGDADRLLQVAWNLLSNGVKFTDGGGTVTTRVAHVGNAVVVSVTDNGHGIDSAFLPHVFERFRQADPSSSRRYGGLGLGLALVKNLVELHGGSVTASSRGHSFGSTFEVSIPVRVVDVAPDPALAGLSEPRGGALVGVRVLLVDDDADAAEIFLRTLTDAGANVVWEPSVQLALGRLQEAPGWRPHVIVSDIAMPDEDGYALVRQVRALPPDCGAATPVIALTAYVTPEDHARALRAGFDAHIAKPFEPKELIEAIVSAFGT